ncbi:metal-dependent hydrolase [Cohnella soli]|uniref:Metal-dependent hydrolase n=1 Tax=Cohnella soli TaxID=425005 RepID=A0ABW0HR68_9BACL
MMGKSHLVISTGLTLSVLGMADEKITIPVAAVTAVSALLPDIDEPNSLLVSRAIPTRFLRFIQTALIGLGIFLYFYGHAYAPWNTVLAALVGIVSFMPTRTLRNVVMVLIGAGLILYGHAFIPWSYIVGSLIILCALLPHRGLTHTVYGVIGWGILLYFSTASYDHAIWIAGTLSYTLHLLADSLTNHGIRPLPPFEWRLKLNLMSTGTRFGAFVESGFMLLTFAVVYLVFFRHSAI